MNFYSMLLTAHSVVRWLLLVFLLYSVFISLKGWISRSGLSLLNIRINAFTVSFAHLQLFIGIILYFISPKVMFSADAMQSPIVRFFTAEHISMMIIAIVLLTIGGMKVKRTNDHLKAAKITFIWFTIALIIILAAIPWPFRHLGAGWI